MVEATIMARLQPRDVKVIVVLLLYFTSMISIKK